MSTSLDTKNSPLHAASSQIPASGQGLPEQGSPGVLAHRTYEDLRAEGLSDVDIMAFAGELLALVASDVRRQPSAADS